MRAVQFAEYCGSEGRRVVEVDAFALERAAEVHVRSAAGHARGRLVVLPGAGTEEP